MAFGSGSGSGSERARRDRGVGLVWFRRDLRLTDNPAWSEATASHDAVVALFVTDDRLVSSAGRFRRRQLFANLLALDGSLRERGGRLVVIRGDPVAVVPELAARCAARRVYWNADVSPYAVSRDAAVRAVLDADVSTSWGHLVLAPGIVTTKPGSAGAAGRVPQVFSSFHKTWLRTKWPEWPAPGDAVVLAESGESIPQTESTSSDPAGEIGARTVLQRFLDDALVDYRAGRDRVAERCTSELSTALKFGTISPRQVVSAVDGSDAEGHAFIRQIAWRDWFAHLLFERPGLITHSMRSEYDRIKWRNDPDGLAAWKEGRTGYPIVDAGMRQLATTGTMHNRVRMIAASFLVKDLLIDWRLGERHFRRLLVDADVSQNVGNWQWVAGTGPDAAPYFRVLNPVLQSRRHDPTGAYLRTWLPELFDVDSSDIHAPWEAGPLDLAAANVTLGDSYPYPIVNHAEARERAIEAYNHARATHRIVGA